MLGAHSMNYFYVRFCLTIQGQLAIIIVALMCVRPWLSWIERLATDQKVGGSNPSGRARKNPRNQQDYGDFVFPNFELLLELEDFSQKQQRPINLAM